MICYFQVGSDKLRTVGAAHNKKQAIVQAARNMLQLLALPNQNDKNNNLKVEYIPLDMPPWSCHFCRIYMTGRRPFLSHLEGRCHNQRLNELGLNVVEENKVLRELAEKAFEEKLVQKRKSLMGEISKKSDMIVYSARRSHEPRDVNDQYISLWKSGTGHHSDGDLRKSDKMTTLLKNGEALGERKPPQPKCPTDDDTDSNRQSEEGCSQFSMASVQSYLSSLTNLYTELQN